MKEKAIRLVGQLLIILLVGSLGYLLFHPELWLAAKNRLWGPPPADQTPEETFFNIEPAHRTPPRFAMAIDTGARRPVAMAFHGGKLLVGYEGLNMIEVFNSGGQRLGYFDAYPQGRLTITGLGFSDDGGFYLVDGRSRKLLAYDAQHAFKGFFPPAASTGQTAPQLPVAITAQRGQVFVVDMGQAAVRVFLASGEEILSINRGGEGEGGRWHPVAAAQTADGRLLVSDLLNRKIAVFNCAGQFAYHFAEPASGEKLMAPGGMAIDDLGRVHLLDGGANRILVYDSYGRFLFGYGLQAPGGRLSPMGGIAVDPEKKLLFIADTANHQIEVWDYQAATAN